jgi:glycosyltransferase involved in cell wall biosynthesis
MRRLVHLAGYRPPQGGSFVPFVRTTLATARERGWGVEAVFPALARERAWLEEFEQCGIPVHLASGSRMDLQRWIEGMVGETASPTLLHTHFTTYDIPAALIARSHPNVSVYWHMHTVLSNRPLAIAANAMKFRIFGRYVARILSPSGDVAATVARRLGDTAKISVFPNTIDPRAFPILTPRERVGFRRELGIPDDVASLLHFGRHWHLKDGDIFLDALGVLVKEGRRVIGIVNQGGDEARAGAMRRGLEEHVKITGVIPEARKLYGAADVLVASSRGETMPFTVMEALSSGVPVVASDLPGHRYLGDELDACTITKRDAREIAAAIAAFLDMDPGERARQRAVARSWIEDHLDVRAAARRLVDAYEQTIQATDGHVGNGGRS